MSIAWCHFQAMEEGNGPFFQESCGMLVVVDESDQSYLALHNYGRNVSSGCSSLEHACIER